MIPILVEVCQSGLKLEKNNIAIFWKTKWNKIESKRHNRD